MELVVLMSNLDAAFQLYAKHIYNKEKFQFLESHGFKIAGSVSPVMWELFCSVLTGRISDGATGADLCGWEVKSAKTGNSFEYQYHLNTGAQKLIDDAQVNHLFCSYSEDYHNVTVRAIRGRDLAEQFFNVWKPEYVANYDQSEPSNKRRQRFRKNIPYRHVEKNGIIVLQIVHGNLVSKNEKVIAEFNK